MRKTLRRLLLVLSLVGVFLVGFLVGGGAVPFPKPFLIAPWDPDTLEYLGKKMVDLANTFPFRNMLENAHDFLETLLN